MSALLAMAMGMALVVKCHTCEAPEVEVSRDGLLARHNVPDTRYPCPASSTPQWGRR